METPKTEPLYCCSAFRALIVKRRVAFIDHTRKWDVILDNTGECYVTDMRYCPFCGVRLPREEL